MSIAPCKQSNRIIHVSGPIAEMQICLELASALHVKIEAMSEADEKSRWLKARTERALMALGDLYAELEGEVV